MPLADDPQFLAFERQFNAAESDLRGQTQHRKSALARAYARQQPQLDFQLEQGTEGILNDFAARGVSSSGVRVQKQNDLVREDAMHRAAALGAHEDQMSEMDYDQARQLAEMRRRRAEAHLTAQRGSAVGPWQSYADAYIGGN